MKDPHRVMRGCSEIERRIKGTSQDPENSSATCGGASGFGRSVGARATPSPAPTGRRSRRHRRHGLDRQDDASQ